MVATALPVSGARPSVCIRLNWAGAAIAALGSVLEAELVASPTLDSVLGLTPVTVVTFIMRTKK